MAIPSVIVSALYAYTGFSRFILDAVVVIAVSFWATVLAGVLLPWLKPAIYAGSPVARIKVFGIPVMTAAGVPFLAGMAWVFYKWFFDSAYGVNDPYSALWMLFLYVLAAAIYFGFKAYRRRKQGIDLDLITRELPTE
jgi:APA family basic amino acid/polyamine antiporter